YHTIGAGGDCSLYSICPVIKEARHLLAKLNHVLFFFCHQSCNHLTTRCGNLVYNVAIVVRFWVSHGDPGSSRQVTYYCTTFQMNYFDGKVSNLPWVSGIDVATTVSIAIKMIKLSVLSFTLDTFQDIPNIVSVNFQANSIASFNSSGSEVDLRSVRIKNSCGLNSE